MKLQPARHRWIGEQELDTWIPVLLRAIMHRGSLRQGVMTATRAAAMHGDWCTRTKPRPASASLPALRSRFRRATLPAALCEGALKKKLSGLPGYDLPSGVELRSASDALPE